MAKAPKVLLSHNITQDDCHELGAPMLSREFKQMLIKLDSIRQRKEDVRELTGSGEQMEMKVIDKALKRNKTRTRTLTSTLTL
jgi:hypothetical protein